MHVLINSQQWQIAVVTLSCIGGSTTRLPAIRVDILPQQWYHSMPFYWQHCIECIGKLIILGHMLRNKRKHSKRLVIKHYTYMLMETKNLPIIQKQLNRKTLWYTPTCCIHISPALRKQTEKQHLWAYPRPMEKSPAPPSLLTKEVLQIRKQRHCAQFKKTWSDSCTLIWKRLLLTM